MKVDGKLEKLTKAQLIQYIHQLRIDVEYYKDKTSIDY